MTINVNTTSFNNTPAQESPRPHTTPSWKRVAKKVAVYAGALLAKGFSFLSYLIPPISICKIYNYFYNRPLNKGINKLHLEKYASAINSGNYPAIHKEIEFLTNRVKIKINQEEWLKSPIPEGNTERLLRRFKKVLTQIARAESDDSILAKDIRSSIDEIVSSDTYQKLKSTTHHPAIQMIKDLSFISTTADATETIQEYGAKVRENLSSGTQTLTKMGDDVDKMNNDMWCFNQNHGILSKIWWGATHLSATWKSLTSILLPNEFNADRGNSIFQAHAIQSPGSPEKTVPLTFGPTPTQPIYFDAHLPYLREKGMSEIRVIMQDTKGHEGQRVAEFYKKTESFRKDGTLILITLPFDMAPMKDPLSLIGDSSTVDNFLLIGNDFTVDSFLLNYAKFILAKDGISDPSASIDQIPVHPDACRNEKVFEQKIVRPIIPENILSDEDLKTCFRLTKDLFNTLLDKVNLNQKSKEEKIKIATTLQLVTQSLMVFSALSKAGKSGKELASLCIHCKQCVDRAVVLISSMILLDHIPTEQEAILSDNIVNLLHGIIVGRPEMVDERLGIAHRVHVTSNLLHVLGDADPADLRSSLKKTFAQLGDPHLAELTHLIQSQASEEAVKLAFYKLDREKQCQIFGKIYTLSGIQSDDLQWGEHHVFDDMDRFFHAVKLDA